MLNVLKPRHLEDLIGLESVWSNTGSDTLTLEPIWPKLLTKKATGLLILPQHNLAKNGK